MVEMKNTFDDLPEYLVPIEHSALGSTWAKKAHKYIAKIGNKYYYDARQLAAAGKQKVSEAAKEVKKDVSVAQLNVKNAKNRANTKANGRAAVTKDKATIKEAQKAVMKRKLTGPVQTAINKAINKRKSEKTTKKFTKTSSVVAKNIQAHNKAMTVKELERKQEAVSAVKRAKEKAKAGYEKNKRLKGILSINSLKNITKKR